MTLKERFALASTPMENSPAGVSIQKIVNEQPTIGFEEARRLAGECLARAAGRKRYRVYTPGQEAKNKLGISARFRHSASLPTTGNGGATYPAAKHRPNGPN